MSRNIRSLLTDAAQRLQQAGVRSSRVDAEWIAAHVWAMTRAELLLTHEVAEHGMNQFWDLINRRAAREPLQHLLGYTSFRFVTLTVQPGVFVPRPETEMVAEAAIKHLVGQPTSPRVVDLCTGSGAIAVAVADEVDSAQVWAVDNTAEAVELAELNARNNDCQVTVVRGDVSDPTLLLELHGSLDVVVANPPYIPQGFQPSDPEVRDYDPPHALYGGGKDGLEIPSAVVARAHQLLKPGGTVIIEHGDNQAEQMRELIRAHGGFRHVRTLRDLTNRERMVLATRHEVAH